MRYHVTVGDRTVQVDLEPDGVRVDGELVEADLRRVPGTRVHHLVLDGRSHRIVCRPDGRGSRDLHVRGRRIRAEVVDERTRAIREMTGRGGAVAGPEPLRAPMPGLVVKISAEEGRDVEPGDPLVVVEAMKMENELRAQAPGRVRRIPVEEGGTVEKDDVLVEFEPPEEP